MWLKVKAGKAINDPLVPSKYIPLYLAGNPEGSDVVTVISPPITPLFVTWSVNGPSNLTWKIFAEPVRVAGYPLVKPSGRLGTQ